MSFKDISKKFSERGFTASPKTIERWVDFLKQDYKFSEAKKSKSFGKFSIFDYFPTFFYERLGIVTVFLIIQEPKDLLFSKYPFEKYHDYASWFYDPSSAKDVLFYSFEVPIEFLEKFKSEWKKLKDKRIVEDYEMYPLHKSFNVYSPWHEVIDENGIFHPEKNNEKIIDEQMKGFEKHLDNLPAFEMSSLIKKNPLIIPIIFEQNRTGWSSVKIWETIKKKRGVKAWEYIQKRPSVLSDNVGIKRVQQAFRTLYSSEIMHQMKVNYIPLELENNFYVYFYLKFEKKKDLLDTVKKISMVSIYSSFRPIVNGNGKSVFVASLAGVRSLPLLFDAIKKKKGGKLFFLQHEKFLSLIKNNDLCKFDYKRSFSAPARKWLF